MECKENDRIRPYVRMIEKESDQTFHKNSVDLRNVGIYWSTHRESGIRRKSLISISPIFRVWSSACLVHVDECGRGCGRLQVRLGHDLGRGGDPDAVQTAHLLGESRQLLRVMPIENELGREKKHERYMDFLWKLSRIYRWKNINLAKMLFMIT